MLIATKQELRRELATRRAQGQDIGFTPTMGALHAGHLSLIQAAANENACVVVSIFVNPTQFGDAADFTRYPRDVNADTQMALDAGADIVFAPSVEEMYPIDTDAFEVSINPGAVARRWEGQQRPGHFAGVALVVTKLLNIVQPRHAYFGEKDYQQLQVLRHLVAVLDMPTTIVGCPIMRDKDGLALSSRNQFLTAAERTIAAAALSQMRDEAQGLVITSTPDTNLRTIEQQLSDDLCAAGLQPDYVALVDPLTLKPADSFVEAVRLLVAARIGSVRLLDTISLQRS